MVSSVSTGVVKDGLDNVEQRSRRRSILPVVDWVTACWRYTTCSTSLLLSGLSFVLGLYDVAVVLGSYVIPHLFDCRYSAIMSFKK